MIVKCKDVFKPIIMKISIINLFVSKLVTKLLVLFCVCLLSQLVSGQDQIIRKDSTILKVKIIEIGDQEIKFKEFKEQNGEIYTIPLSEVLAVIYENGEKKEFKLQQLAKYVEVSKKISFDSLQCVEDLLGVKLENSTGTHVGIKITKVLENSVFKDQFQRVENSVMNSIGSEKMVKVKKTSDFVREIFALYKQGKTLVDMSILAGGKLSRFTPGKNWIDISGLSKCMEEPGMENEKLSPSESRKAGASVAKLYFKRNNRGMSMTGGMIAGMVGGVPGTLAMSSLAMLPVNAYMVPMAPGNVDVEAWNKAYSSKIKSMKFGRTIVGGALGTLYIFAFIPILCAL